jgi:DNA replication protein DnaC
MCEEENEMMTNQTLDKLSGMGLSAMAQEYRRQMELPAVQALPWDERTAMLVDAQWLARANSRLKKLLREANLREPSACLEDVNYDPRRKVDKPDVARLSDCAWIREAQNLIITGATGTGKTWLSSAFGNAACRLGLRVRYHRMNRLLTSLAIGRGDGSWDKLLNELKRADLLILDDFGMSPLDPASCRDLLEIIDERHGRKSTIISAQLPVSQWHAVFEDATIADAVLDRLVHSAHRFELHGPSLRAKDVAAVPAGM